MVQDAFNARFSGYGQAASVQSHEAYSYDTMSDRGWQEPAPHPVRAPAAPAQTHPGLVAEPDAERLFAQDNVHFEQQFPNAADHTGAGYDTGYESGYVPHQSPHGQSAPHAAYVYQTDDLQPEDIPARPQLGAAQWGGAAVSLALILGLGIWGYNLMVRDVAGVPVIRALEGSARILPEEPGGQLAMHQGLAVNSVTADGSAAPPADQYILAPAPATLSAEDQPMANVEPVLSNLGLDSTAPLEPVDGGVAEALEQIAVEEDPMELQGVAEVSAPVEAAISAEGKLIRSPIPRARPVQLASLAADPAATSAAALAMAEAVADHSDSGVRLDDVAGDILAAIGAASELPASDVPVGTRLVQLGAYQSEDVARSEWDRLSGRFSELMEGKTRVIETASSGGKAFYRLRAYGFADAADTNRFCAALMAMNASCTPTVQR